MMTTEPATDREVPRWVGAMIAILLLSAFVGGGGYWIWARATQPLRSDVVEVQGLPQARAAINLAPAPPAMGVQRSVSGNQITYTVRAKDCLLVLANAPDGKKWTLSPRYNKPDLMNADQTSVLNARFRLVNDPGFAKSVKLTDEQRTKLIEVPSGAPMVPSAADLAKLQKLFDAYLAASNQTTEQALVKGLTEVAAASLNSTRASIDERVKKIQTILSPEQIAPFK